MIKYYKKIKLYGAGHPSIPHSFFGVEAENDEGIKEFFNGHDTTHARFQEIEKEEIPKDFFETLPIYRM